MRRRSSSSAASSPRPGSGGLPSSPELQAPDYVVEMWGFPIAIEVKAAHGPGGKAHDRGNCVTPYFPSMIMLPSMSLSEWLGPKLSSRLLVSTRRPLLAPSVILPTRWV